MVRRTKADALATRNSLLDAAEHLFQERGVSRTSLNDIAIAAGTTRGAIYWHFKDKADLFNAMMERVTMPLEGTLACTARTADTTANPLLSLRDSMMAALKQTATDDQTRRVFEVATHKVESAGETASLQLRHREARDACIVDFEKALRLAARRARLKLPLPAAMAAHGLHALISGLIQNWLLAPEAFALVPTGRRTFNVYLAGLGFDRPGLRGELDAPEAALR